MRRSAGAWFLCDAVYSVEEIAGSCSRILKRLESCSSGLFCFDLKAAWPLGYDMQNRNPVPLLFALPALILCIPLVAMQFTAAVQWTLADFIVAGGLLYGSLFGFRWMTSRRPSRPFSTGAALAIFSGLLMIWATLAIGIIGNESEPINQLYLCLAVGLVVFSALGRFEAPALSRLMFGAAVIQALIPAGAYLFAGIGLSTAQWVFTAVFTSCLAALFALSAALFRRSASMVCSR